MSQFNEDNAASVILTAEEMLQSLNIKEEQIKKVIEGPRILESTAKQAEKNLQWYTDAEQELAIRLHAETLVENWNRKGLISVSDK